MFQETMRRAAALTRSGDVGEATRLIQQGLSGSAASADGPTPGTAPRLSKTDGQAKRGADPAKPKARGETWRRSRPNLRVKSMRGREAPVAPGARYEWRTYESAWGSRRYRLYVPAALAGKAEGAPLIVMLHGCTQDPDDFALGTRMNVLAERHGYVVAYPEQTRAANAMACWNWFQPAQQARTGSEPGSIAGIACEIVATEGLDASRVFVAGLSAGGAMAAVLGQTHGDVFKGIGVHSGLPHGSARDVQSAQAAMARGADASGPAGDVPTIVIHGDSDRTVHPGNGARLFEAGAGTRALRQEGAAQVTTIQGEDGTVIREYWEIDGLGHAWSGGDAGGTHTAPGMPDASEAMLRFFLKR